MSKQYLTIVVEHDPDNMPEDYIRDTLNDLEGVEVIKLGNRSTRHNKLDQRLEWAHTQPDAEACNTALSRPFHGMNANQIRRAYIKRYGVWDRTIPVAGEALGQAVIETYHQARG